MNGNLWQRKTLAHLRHPPDSAGLDAAGRINRTRFYAARMGIASLGPENTEAGPVLAAFPWISLPAPASASAILYRHPLTAATPGFAFPGPQELGRCLANALPNPAGLDWRTRFWLLWRLWMTEAVDNASQQSPEALYLPFLPADTRIPDTTVWHVNSMAGAFESARDERGVIQPALLLFSLHPMPLPHLPAGAPDGLWSRRFLLSWLMGRAIQCLTDLIGPDTVVFPFLRGHPLYDWLNRDKLRSTAPAALPAAAASFWDKIGGDQIQSRALTSFLPSHFLAVVPANFEVSALEQAIDSEWKAITAACWTYLDEHEPSGSIKTTHPILPVGHLLHAAWQLWPELDSRAVFTRWPVSNPGPQSTFCRNAAIAGGLRARDSDENQDAGRGIDAAWAWPANHLLLAHRHASRSATWDFPPWPAAVGPGKADALAALDLIHRVWPMAYLAPAHQLDHAAIAAQTPTAATLALSPTGHVAAGDNSTALAVLTLNTALLGPGLDRANPPSLRQAISAATIESLQARLDTPSVEKGVSANDWLDSPRPCDPAFHLQLSEALGNVALYVARRIVLAHHGYLLRATGDQLLAVVPIREALACARGLRWGFSGAPDLARHYPAEFAAAADGFFQLTSAARQPGEPAWPLLAPGPKTALSACLLCGAPPLALSVLIDEADRTFDRTAAPDDANVLTVSLYQTPDVSLTWYAPFDSPLCALFAALLSTLLATPGENAALKGNGNPARFIASIGSRLERYRLNATPGRPPPIPLDPDMRAIVEAEIEQASREYPFLLPASPDLRRLCADCLEALEHSRRPLADFERVFAIVRGLTQPPP